MSKYAIFNRFFGATTGKRKNKGLFILTTLEARIIAIGNNCWEQ
jgi:hypothetical protein